jgi:hypothetical protein
MAASMLSDACMAVFEGKSEARYAARNLDFYAYGAYIREQAHELAKAILNEVADQEAGDLVEETEED